ncbi:MAG: DNA-directed RNA polymerase subunit beta' [bacterium]|nr:DNA-directed RNA polymerase subunit beta' [bacterium]
MNTKVTDFESIIIKLASPQDILSWSHGEVTKAETINYRTQRAERDGLFDERIFGPEKDYECYCGKYRRIRYKGIICEKCGVEVTRSVVRRERMGHITLASPVSHVWFLRGTPSRLGLLFSLAVSDLEKVVYFAGPIVTHVNEDLKLQALTSLDKEFQTKNKKLESKQEKADLKEVFSATKQELENITLYKVMSDTDYRRLSLKYGEIFEAGVGAEALLELAKKIDLQKMEEKFEKEYERATPLNRKKVVKQLGLVRSMRKSGIRPEWMFLSVVPIIPPALRPMVQLDGGRHATSDVNDLYRRVINRNNRLKKLLELNAPEVIVRNEKRMLQESVDALIDNSIRRSQGAAISQAQKRPLRSLADMLRGKQGRFRQNLLGKRVDYSGRSVIVVGPELKLDQCGLPKHMALELFRPFVISKLISRELAYNIRGANRLIDEKTNEVWGILEEVIKDKHVLLNRAPTLHRLGIQAFRPVLVEGNAIQIHPLVCQAFNADFDGDQMAVHVPLSEEAQKEAREIMSPNKNLLIPRTGDPIVNPSQDIVLGCYWMTRLHEGAKGDGMVFSSPNEAIMAYDFEKADIQAKIKVLVSDTPKYQVFENKLIETTVGRLLFNSVMPNDFPYINEELTKKKLGKIVENLISHYGADKTPNILDRIKSFGFEYAMKAGISWGMGDLKTPEGKAKVIEEAKNKEREIHKNFNEGLLTEEERYHQAVFLWQEAKAKVDEMVPATLDQFGPVYSMVTSAARGSWIQINQMAGMRGLVRNPAGKIMDFPILSSYKEGLNVLEYFISTHGARKGTADTALKTAKAGYLARRLVDVAQDIIVAEKDCKDKKGFLISRVLLNQYDEDMESKIRGRFLAQDVKAGNVVFKKGKMLSAEDAKLIDKSGTEEVRIRSTLTCKAKWGVCQICYGRDLGSNDVIGLGAAVGIVAAQAIGEPGTQLTMRTFHTGGVASRGGDITLGLPRVEELFEARTPKNLAILSEVDGMVVEIKEPLRDSSGSIGDRVVVVLPGEEAKDKSAIDYKIPFGKRVLVEKDQMVKAGDPLSDGSIDIKQLFKLAKKEVTQNYILKEVARVYNIQGVSINDKHLEIIVRQMFSRVRVKEAGDTNLSVGKIIERAEFNEENERMRVEGGEEAKGAQLIMPISKVALTTSSFLSAASFQDTARVLIRAAVEGAKDKLRGLKENVIIGRLIPAGTGFYAYERGAVEQQSSESSHEDKEELVREGVNE